MHSRIRSLFLSLCYLTPLLTSAAIHHLKMPTTSLADSNRVIVATPTNFDSLRPNGYPYIIMLHGWSGDETQWEKDADLQFLADTFALLLVLPDGGYDGWWMDNERVAGRNYESYLSRELKPWVTEHFNGSTAPLKHGIMGLSMGGYGALVQVLKYPGTYAAAASLSGVMDITRHPDSWGLKRTLEPFSEQPGRWRANNPLDLAQRSPGQKHLSLLLICGRDDFAFEENQVMAHQLDRLGYEFSFVEAEGAHTHQFWKAHVQEAISYIASRLQR